MIRRRQFITGLGSAATWPLVARAQQSAVPVIGLLSSQSADDDYENFTVPFLQGLKETGYVEGQNVAVEYRFAENQYDRLPALAADLVRRRVAVIVAYTTNTALAAQAATRTIPIVFSMGSDPVALGLVASLNRPTGNLTGVATLSGDIAPKRLALLHELVPSIASIAMLVNPANPSFVQAETKDLQSAARVLGVRVAVLNGGTESDIAAVFATLVERQVSALLISNDTFIYAARHQIISLAARYAIPTMFYDKASVAAGGLLSYGTDLRDGFRHVGLYAGRILKGEKPGDLPVVQPTKFELAINLKTAKALGLTIPETLLATADEVIQ
jgi:putative tryptophan/tyrosine transport system substrate-binding protein